MNEYLKQIREKVFEKLPYSKESVELVEKLDEAFEKEYEQQLANGQSDVAALGFVMQKYGNKEEAVSNIEIDEETLEKIENKEISLEYKRFHKNLRIVIFLSIIIGYSITNALYCGFKGIVFGTWGYIFNVSLDIVIGGFCFYNYRRLTTLFDYNSVCLDKKTWRKYVFYQDRYKKRFLNSIFVLTEAFVIYTFGIMFVIHGNNSQSENVNYIGRNFIVACVGIFVVLVYLLVIKYVMRAVNPKEREEFKSYAYKLLVYSMVALVIIVTVGFVTTYIVKDIKWTMVGLMSVNGIILLFALVYNYKMRAKLVIKNLRVNYQRCVCLVLAFVVLCVYGVLRRDTYVLEPYVSTTARVEHENHDIYYDDETGVYTIEAGDGDFKILHLTDIHIGGSTSSAYNDLLALEACRKIITYTEPDFVIVTGDLVFPLGIMSQSINNQAPVRTFANFMRNIGIPWAFTYGNHDTESVATGSVEDIEQLYQSLSYKTTGSLLYPYIQPNIAGRSNQMIKIVNQDETLRQGIVLLDSNDYTGEGINEYDYIHDDQVEWYEQQIVELQEEYGDEAKSLVFFHMPLQEYKTANDLYESGSDEVQYYFGVIGETMIDKICCSNYHSKLFDTAVRLGSTKGMFCGHDHYNNISLGYKGIRLTYGMSIDYLAMPGIDKKTEQRGAELITIHKDSSFDVEQVKLTDVEMKIPSINDFIKQGILKK